MKKSLLKLIECRKCKVDFSLQATELDGEEIMSGSLSCPSCKQSFPILKGVPRFLSTLQTPEDLRRVYADSFGHQWTTYNWQRDEDEFEFFQITDLKPDDLKGKVVF